MENLAAEFEVFWKQYPRHVAKIAAFKAFKRARQSATLTELLTGVEAYKRGKPAYADWAHASTWLNQGRWMDEYDEPQRRAPVKADRPFSERELAAARDWWRRVGCSMSEVDPTEAMANFIRRRLRLETNS